MNRDHRTDVDQHRQEEHEYLEAQRGGREALARLVADQLSQGFDVAARDKSELRRLQFTTGRDINENTKSDYVDVADRIIAALPSLGFTAVPAGWRVVPKEPTEAMMVALLHGSLGDVQEDDEATCKRVWAAMLAAAPEGQAVPAWRPISEARIAQRVLAWHPGWRSPFPAVTNGDHGAVYVDTCEPEAKGWQATATHFIPLPAHPPPNRRRAEMAIPDAGEAGLRLPDWNALTNEQRSAICDEGDRWSFDRYFERDAAHAIYEVIREQLALAAPPSPPPAATDATAVGYPADPVATPPAAPVRTGEVEGLRAALSEIVQLDVHNESLGLGRVHVSEGRAAALARQALAQADGGAHQLGDLTDMVAADHSGEANDMVAHPPPASGGET